MKHLFVALGLPVVLCVAPLSSWAGDDHDHHHRHHRAHKQTYWDGHCEVERKWKKNGEYKEKRKCRAPQAHYGPPHMVYVQPPAVYALPRPPEGLVIQSHIQLR